MWKLLQYISVITALLWLNTSAQPKKTYKPAFSNNSFCSSLNMIIEASHSGFSSIKGKSVQNNNGFWRNVYCTATVSLPGTKECRITENLFTSYECTVGRWDAYTQQVTQEYEKITNNIKQCLPAGWESREEKNKNSNIVQFECAENTNTNLTENQKPRIIVRLFKISSSGYQLDFKAIAPITE